MRWAGPRFPSVTQRRNSGKVCRAGPEKRKSSWSAWAASVAPIGVSQLAPPITVSAAGLRSLITRAIARLGTVWANIELNPTTSASARR